jgi:hypothetical protein
MRWAAWDMAELCAPDPAMPPHHDALALAAGANGRVAAVIVIVALLIAATTFLSRSRAESYRLGSCACRLAGSRTKAQGIKFRRRVRVRIGVERAVDVRLR